MQVSMDKKYKTKSGKPARIISVNRFSNAGYTVVALIQGELEEAIETFTEDGYINRDKSGSEIDLVEIHPWDDIKINDPVIAKIGDRKPFKAHFAGIINGHPSVYPNCCSSWTCEDEPFLVDDVRKPVEAEMIGLGKIK